MTLPAETLTRCLPELRRSEDAALFAAELTRSFPPVETQTQSGDFFPKGWHGDMTDWKGELRALWIRTTHPRERFEPSSGRQPLVATDRFSNGFFHWVTETLPRLWWIREQLSRLELILPSFANRLPYMVESLAIFPSMTYRIAPTDKRWKLKEALLVPATAPVGNYRPPLVASVGATWREKSQPRLPFRKVYISRSRAARRRITNEGELVSHLEARGFETFHLEGMAFEDQVRLMAEATHLVSNHGAGLTNLMFMVPGTKVTEIRLAGDGHNNCYFSLARSVGVHYDYRLAQPSRSGASPHQANLVVDAQGLA